MPHRSALHTRIGIKVARLHEHRSQIDHLDLLQTLAAEPEHAALFSRLMPQLETHFARHELPERSGVRPGGPEPTNRTATWAL